MENFIVSARKYRPKEFDTVVGQSHITDTLEHAIENNQLAQALLFCGPRGVGKTSCARILAKKINEQFGASDEDHFSFNIHELDAASNNSVDDIRGLIDQVRFAPQVGKYKVYIIDEAHMLSQSAFNAFLKTLEEPPAHAIFILATTEKHKIIPTILSRCQIYDFKRITIEDIQQHLRTIAEKEAVTYEDDALFLIAQKADGALRDALSIFDRMVTFTQKDISVAKVAEVLNILDYDQYLNIVDLAKENKIPEVLYAFNEIVKKGFDPHIFIAGLGSHFRDVMMAQHPSTLSLIEVGEKTKAKYAEQSQKWTVQQLVDAVEICNHADINYKNSKNPRLTVEIALMQLSSLTAIAGQDKKKKFLILAPALHSEQPKTEAEDLEPIKTPQKEIEISEKNLIKQVEYSAKPLVQKSLFSEFNISLALKKKEELTLESFEENKPLPEQHFTQTDLDREWQLFINDLKTKNTLAFSAIRGFKLNKILENTVEILYPSESAKNEFDAIQLAFFNHFKHRVNNYNITVHFKKDEELMEGILTKKNIFEKFLEVNPLLKDLNDLMAFDFNQ